MGVGIVSAQGDSMTYDYADPGTDAAYCDGITLPIPEYCLWNPSHQYEDLTFYPYCCADCALQAEIDSEEDHQ